MVRGCRDSTKTKETEVLKTHVNNLMFAVTVSKTQTVTQTQEVSVSVNDPDLENSSVFTVNLRQPADGYIQNQNKI